MRKRLAILGSTGSIGTQALEVVRQHSDLFVPEVLTAGNNSDLLIRQAREFSPNAVVIGNTGMYQEVREALKDFGVKVFAGEDAIEQVVEMDSVDMVLSALVGYAGLKPTLRAIQARKDIALANKEVLVVAGSIITREALRNHVLLLPVDSEHSAVFQCLAGEPERSAEKLILTASGGPFRGMSRDSLLNASRNEALNHPNWRMGNKITIDSATLMNKGLEVIEAYWLFGLPPESIDVLIHPQSVIHSMVQFRDGSVKAQLGVPDMRIPILYALGFPGRISSDFPRLVFSDYPALTFEMPDRNLFRALDLSYFALGKGGNMPCVLNAANEVAVDAFLRERISFLDIPDIIENALQHAAFIQNPSIEELLATHEETMGKAGELLKMFVIS